MVFLLSGVTTTTWAQAPEGIVYQAEARDNKGELMANKTLEVKVSVLEGSVNGATTWEGKHQVLTNDFGMFVLVIGTGSNEFGTQFNAIPWESDLHFLNVQVKNPGNGIWIDMGTTQFLSVPYALHAKTASSLTNEAIEDLKSGKRGVPSQTWSLFGNSKSDPEKDKMGTTDATDLVFVTDNIERLRITADGRIITGPGKFTMGGNLEVQGDSTIINNDLYVGRDVYLNFNDTIEPHGQTFNGGNFTVENNSSTLLTGTLNVDSITTITDTTQSTAIDNGALIVNGGTGIARNLNVGEEFSVQGRSQFDKDINVDGKSITNKLIVDTALNPDSSMRFGSIADVRGLLVADSIVLSGGLVVGGNLRVKGDSVIISNDLYVHGNTNLKGDLNLTKNDTGFVATFFNKNGAQGDGIRISLGRKATKHGGGFDLIDNALKDALLQGYGPGEFSAIKGLFDGELGSEDVDFLISLATPNSADLDAIAVSVCKLSEELSRVIFVELNKTLNNALNITIPELCVDIPHIPVIDVDLGTVCVPGTPKTLMNGADLIPDLPVDALDFGCEDIGNNFILPSLDFADQTDVLNKNNSFIEFTDGEDNWKMGAITAQTIDEWASQYLDPVFLYGLYSTFQGLDRAKAFPEMRKIAKEVATSYLAIGVQYGSGNGDYAEWLERFDHSENISAGDIVAVKGGKITKDLKDAEQIMAVSEKPIVLGNIPEEGMGSLGNNVAFMGQIPVKIMGSVATGDYIVGTSDIPGYGVAISPQNMTIEDFKYAVGRSWDANTDNGPKMVNTVVGVHNGDYLNILKRYEQKFRESEERLQSVEAKIDALSTFLQQAQNAKE